MAPHSVRIETEVDHELLLSAGFSSFIKRPSVPFTRCCAAMMRTLVTRTLRLGRMLLSSTCPCCPLSWSRCLSSTISVVSGMFCGPFEKEKKNLLFLKHYMPQSPFHLLDSSLSRARLSSAYFEDTDPDSGNIISQSVAMAIAGSPLPHAKANPFALPSVVSDNGNGQPVLLGRTD